MYKQENGARGRGLGGGEPTPALPEASLLCVFSPESVSAAQSPRAKGCVLVLCKGRPGARPGLNMGVLSQLFCLLLLRPPGKEGNTRSLPEMMRILSSYLRASWSLWVSGPWAPLRVPSALRLENRGG